MAEPAVAITRFSPDEGDVVALVEVLLGHRRSVRSTRFEPLREVRPALLEALCDRVVRASVQLLYREGGARRRTVLRDGHRVYGRAFDPERADELHLEFSDATERLLLELALRAQHIFGVSEKVGKRFAREVLPAQQGTKSGDWLFFALVDQHLDRVPLEPDAARALQGRLRGLSPLAALRAPEAPRGADAQVLFGPLLAPGAVAIVESVPDWLQSAWTEALSVGLRRPRDHEAFCDHFELTAGALRAWLALLDEHRRLDLALPLGRAVRDFGDELIARADPRLYIRERARAASVAQGDRALRAVAACVGVVDQLALLRDLMGAQRYEEERYEEAQVYLGDYDAELAPAAPALMDLGRVLEGRIG